MDKVQKTNSLKNNEEPADLDRSHNRPTNLLEKFRKLQLVKHTYLLHNAGHYFNI